MHKINKKYLILFILVFTILLGVGVFADEWIPLIETEGNEGKPLGSLYTMNGYYPWRHSDGGEGQWKYLKEDGVSSYWSGIKDKDFLAMVRGQRDNSKIYEVERMRVFNIHPYVLDYLKAGGNIENVKIRYKAQMLSEEQGFDIDEWGKPEGDIYNPKKIFYKEPEYKLDLVNNKIYVRWMGKLAPPLENDRFYGPNQDPKMKNVVLTADHKYGANGFSMWGHSGTSGNIGSATSAGTYDGVMVEHPLTKDMIMNAGGYITPNTTLTNSLHHTTFNSNNVRIGAGTFSNGGAIGYLTRQPILVEFFLDDDGNNIRIGSDRYKIGDDYNAKLIDVETGKALDPETDKLVLGKKYKFDYHLAYTSNKEDKIKTNNSPIITNIYHYYNGSDDIGKYYESISDTKKLPYLEMVNKAGENLNLDKYEESEMDLSKLANYQHEFEIEQLDKDGKKVEKIKICANLPWQNGFYTKYNDDEALGDNDNRTDDEACVEFQVDNNLANTMVAHSANNVSFNNYDKLEVRKNNQLISSVSGEVVLGDDLNLRAFVKRSDIPITPKEKENPILIKDVSLVLNETINEQVKPIEQRETNTIYKAGFTRIKPQIKQISFRNENGTQGPFVNYSASTHGSQKFEAGTILMFEMNYKVPEHSEMFGERSSKYNGYYAPVSKALNKLALSFNLVIDHPEAKKVNNLTSDDWTKAVLTVTANKRNMEITEVVVKDEGGRVVKPAGNSNLLVLDGTKNYYFEPKILYSYLPNQNSINQNLKAEVYVVYDGAPPETTNVAESEKKGYWRNGDIGTYSLNQQPNKVNNVGNYYPNRSYYQSIANAISSKPNNISVSPFNPLMLPIKYLNVSGGSIVVKIPDTYKGNDNQLQSGVQMVEIPFVVEGSVDNSVTITKFYDHENKDVGVNDTDSACIGIDPSKGYTLEFEIKRERGTGDFTDFNLAEIKNKIKVTYDTDAQTGVRLNYEIVPEKSTRRNGTYALEQPGDIITIRVKNLMGKDGRIGITAGFDHYDSNMSNNLDNGCWMGLFNFSVSEFNLNPSSIQMTTPASNPTRTDPIKISFNAVIGFEDFLPDEYKNKDSKIDYNDIKVPIEIREFRNGRPTGNIYFSTKTMNLAELPVSKGANSISYTFDKEITFTELGQYTYQISVNGGNGTDTSFEHNYRKYKEINPHRKNSYEDNVALATITVDGCKDKDCPPPSISGSRSGANSWSETFYSYSYTGTPEEYMATVCSGGDNPTCWEELRCRCIDPSETGPANSIPYNGGDTINFYERYGMDIYVQTQEILDKRYGSTLPDETGTWVKITNGKTIIRAGQWFDIRVITNYEQNRFPCRGKGAIPLCNSGFGCYDCHATRSTHATPPSYYITGEQKIFIQTRAYGKTENYELMKPSKGIRSNGARSSYTIPNKRNSDALGQSSTRKYVSTHTRDGEYYINVKNMPFDNLGKWTYDENHPAKSAGGMQTQYQYVDGLRCNGGGRNCARSITTSTRQYAEDVSATIVIKNQLNIKTQIIGN